MVIGTDYIVRLIVKADNTSVA